MVEASDATAPDVTASETASGNRHAGGRSGALEAYPPGGDHPGADPSGNDPGFGVYVHWPFCAAKCPYCDFNSHVRSGGIDEARFLAGYEREIAHMAALMASESNSGGDGDGHSDGHAESDVEGRDNHGTAGNPVVSSIFFGGGTPSLMPPAVTGAILDCIARHWPIDQRAEITLEANPTSVEANRFQGYRAAGINRVSLGVQSLIDADLKALGRLHSASEARAAIDIARQTFERYSFDLIYARARQTLASWRAELQDALALTGGHLSLYQLTIEEGTPFAALHKAGKLIVPEGEPAHDLYELTQDMMETAGLPAYEISNHAAPAEESRHNMLYWRYGTYAGIGAGAHGRLMIDGKRQALETERSPERWLELVEDQGHGLIGQTILAKPEQADEMLLMGLRLREGVDLARMQRLTGLAPAAAILSDLAHDDLIEISNAPAAHLRAPAKITRIRASRQGRFLLNRIVLQISENLEPA